MYIYSNVVGANSIQGGRRVGCVLEEYCTVLYILQVLEMYFEMGSGNDDGSGCGLGLYHYDDTYFQRCWIGRWFQE
jgi:hypothetical protein